MLTPEKREEIARWLSTAPSEWRDRLWYAAVQELLAHSIEMDAALKAERELGDALAVELAGSIDTRCLEMCGAECGCRSESKALARYGERRGRG